MMPPIWPWARRCIHTRNPTRSRNGRRTGIHVSQKLVDGVENLMPLEVRRLALESGSGVGPVVVTFSPLVSVAEMWPLELSYVPDFTSSFLTWFMKVPKEI